VRIREATFALRVVRRRTGTAGVVYRRSVDEQHRERFTRVAFISPLTFSAGARLLRAGVRAIAGNDGALTEGPYHPLDEDWGPRVACFALVAAGLRDAEKLHRAARNIQEADGVEAAWWLGLLTSRRKVRAIRALRILVEAVQ
jgi:hypothetical protein